MSTHDEHQKPTPTDTPAQGKQRDDALFEALGKSRKQKRRKIIRTVLILILIVAIVLVSAVAILRRRVQERFAASQGDVLTHVVQEGTISTVVSGSGILTNVDTETVTVPTGVELTEILIENGDIVAEGQLLALADMATVRSAMSTLQSQIGDLDDQIADADSDKADTYVYAGVPGRVKAVYGQVDMTVADVMIRNGALAELSLDGYMAVDVESSALTEGTSVTVTREDGSQISGTVSTVINGVATVLVSDDGPRMGETVSVSRSDGVAAGSGELYIHKPLKITGYAGTIQGAYAVENALVYQHSYLFTLKDTEYSANYDTLLRSRNDSEETLLELLQIQKYGGITAPVAGSVYSVADLDSEIPITDLATLSPDKEMSVTISVDESDILSLKLEQETNVTVSSVTEDTLVGVVTEIDKTASDGAYTAVVTLDMLPGMLPGMTADVDVKIQGSENALLVPADAVHYTSTGAYVYTTYDEEIKEYGGRTDVVIGLSNDDYVEIISGLKVGDTVCYTKTQSIFDMFAAMSGMGGNQGGNRNNRQQAPAMPQGGNRQQAPAAPGKQG